MLTTDTVQPFCPATVIGEAPTHQEQQLRNINIRGVPVPTWQHARQQALAANQPFRIWIIDLLENCQPCPLTSHLTIPAPTATKTVHVRNVPEKVWRRAKENAIASGLTLRIFVINLLATPTAPPPNTASPPPPKPTSTSTSTSAKSIVSI